MMPPKQPLLWLNNSLYSDQASSRALTEHLFSSESRWEFPRNYNWEHDIPLPNHCIPSISDMGLPDVNGSLSPENNTEQVDKECIT
jgi:hypothetical protein